MQRLDRCSEVKKSRDLASKTGLSLISGNAMISSPVNGDRSPKQTPQHQVLNGGSRNQRSNKTVDKPEPNRTATQSMFGMNAQKK